MTTAKEVARTTKNETMDATPGRASPHAIILMPTFSYKALQPNGAIAEGVLDAPGRPDALRQIETLGLRPVDLSEKAARRAAKNGIPVIDPGKISFKFESKKVPPGPGKFHAVAFQPAGGGCAVEPRAGDPLQGSVSAGVCGQMEGNP